MDADVEKRAALSQFYREEFLRQIEHLQAAGILDETNREVEERARHVVTRLDQLCSCRCFPAMAETLLQSFDALSGFSTFDPRLRH
jgi:hypothetical protein